MERRVTIDELGRLIPGISKKKAEYVLKKREEDEYHLVNGSISLQGAADLKEWEAQHVKGTVVLKKALEQVPCLVGEKVFLEKMRRHIRGTGDWQGKMFWDDYRIPKDKLDKAVMKATEMLMDELQSRDSVQAADTKINEKDNQIQATELCIEKYISISDVVDSFSKDTGLIMQDNAVSKLTDYLKSAVFEDIGIRLSGVPGWECKEEAIKKYQNKIRTLLYSCASKGKINGQRICSFLYEKFPETAEAILRYEVSADKKSQFLELRMAILALADKEVAALNNNEVETVMIKINRYWGSGVARLFQELIKRIDIVKGTNHSVINIESVNKETSLRSNPYPIEKWVRIVGMTYCLEFIQERKLYEKAITDSAFSGILLFQSLHAVSMWRKTDYLLIPQLIIPSSINFDEVISRFQKGNFSLSQEDAQSVLMLFETQSENRYTHKTHAPLVFSAPRSSVESLAVYMLCAEYHRRLRNSKYLIDETGIDKVNLYRELYGKECLEWLEGKAFSSMRANHSYADCLSTTVQKRTKGYEASLAYMAVSYARSHKGGLRLLSTSTAHYLSSKTNGIPVAEFMLALFERGAFGWTLYSLLEALLPSFEGLSVKEQTDLLGKFNYSPRRLEETAFEIVNSRNSNLSSLCDLINTGTAEERKEKIVKLTNSLLEQIKGDGKVLKDCTINYLGMDCPYGGPSSEKCLQCSYSLKFIPLIRELAKDIEKQRYVYKHSTNENIKSLANHMVQEKLMPTLKSICKEYSETYEVPFKNLVAITRDIQAEMEDAILDETRTD